MNRHEAIAELCDTAYDIIDSEGWWNGQGEKDEDCGECIVTAIFLAARERRLGRYWVDAVNAVAKHAGCESLPRWNDKQNETVVLLTLEAVADHHRARS